MMSDFDTVYDRTGSESSKWHTHPADVLPMYVADMDFKSPPAVIDALASRVQHGFFGYGKEEPEFFEVVRERLKQRYAWDVPAEAIVTLPGVIPGFNLAAKTFLSPGEHVLMHTPTYPPIYSAPANHQLERDETPLLRTENGRYEFDAAAFDAAFTPATRMFILCNPHNPTGRVFTAGELRAMATACLERDTFIVSDEIHCDLVFEPNRHVPIASLSEDIARRSITLMAPSKTFNLAGMRFAIAIITDNELRERFIAGKHGLVSGVNILGYTAAKAAYAHAGGWLDDLIAYLDANRSYVGDFLARELPELRWYPPEGTYLGWIDCSALRLESPQAYFLEEARVALSDGANFGTGGEQFVRLNFGCPRSLLEEGLSRLLAAVEKLRRA